MVSTKDLESYVQWEDGLISAHVFSSQEVYELELERVFGKSWLFLAHDCQIPKPGDFFSTYMGADPVMIVRQADGSVAAFLNACRHRGLKVCRADEGNAKAFTCTYHGWSYDTEGKLISVPNQQEIYGENLDMTRWGLVPVARLQSYKGLWFGSFDTSIVSLEDYMGGFKYYIDLFVDAMPNGIEFIGGTQKAKMTGNWKLAAEQFGGDSYHAFSSHISDFAAVTPKELYPARKLNVYENFRNFGDEAGHGIGYNLDRHPQRFAAHGATSVIDEYMDTKEDEVSERLGEERSLMYRGNVAHMNLFPNFSGLSSPQTLRVWHPKGPNEMEMYSWVFVDKDAPVEVKNQMRWITQHHFGPQGLAEQDDGENFALIGTNLSRGGTEVKKLMLNYRMGLDDRDPTSQQTLDSGASPSLGEKPQRLFYRRWLELMTAES